MTVFNPPPSASVSTLLDETTLLSLVVGVATKVFSLLPPLGVALSSEFVFEFGLVESEEFETLSLFAEESESELKELESTPGSGAIAAAGEASELGCRSGSRQGQSGDLYFAEFQILAQSMQVTMMEVG